MKSKLRKIAGFRVRNVARFQLGLDRSPPDLRILRAIDDIEKERARESRLATDRHGNPYTAAGAARSAVKSATWSSVSREKTHDGVINASSAN